MGREGMLGEGGSFGDFTLTVDKAYFAESEKYGRGVLFLHLLGRTDNEAQPVFSADGPYHPSWSCGNGWSSSDGGATATHEKGKKGFFPQSAIQEALITPAMEVTASLVGTKEDPFDGADSLKADLWVGTKWHFNEQDKTFTIKDKDTGEMVERTRTSLVPVEYLGKADAVGSAATVSNGEVDAAPNGDIRDQLIELAKTSDDFTSFMVTATKVPGVKQDVALFEAVVNEESGIWAEANAS